MKNVLIIFGGRSAEHEISIISARNVVGALDRKRFKPVLVVISRQGSWYHMDSEDIPDDITDVSESLPNGELCSLIRKPEGAFLILQNNEQIKIDVAFPVLHGPMGEDGTIQGLFDIFMLPFVGAGVLASAICMDKDICKKVLEYQGLPVVPYITLYDRDAPPSFEEACKKLGSDAVFIKPSAMGSSVGIEKAKNQEDFVKYLENAFKYSSKIVLEKSINVREVECAVLGNTDPIATSIAEIRTNHEFYSYEAKYLDPDGAELIVPAKNISPKVESKIKSLAIEVFKVTECKGMARIDFFIDENDEVYINEPNTIPGFTSISMYPQMVMAYGISYSQLITKLIDYAIEEYEYKSSISMVPDTEVVV